MAKRGTHKSTGPISLQGRISRRAHAKTVNRAVEHEDKMRLQSGQPR